MNGYVRGMFRGQALLLALLVAGAASAGMPMRDDEAHVHSVFDALKRPQGFLPANLKSVWVRFVEAIEKARGTIPRPALLDRDQPPRKPDLGDDFLRGFAQERGLRRKLQALSAYLATLGRTHRWLQTLSVDHQQALKQAFGALAREAKAAEGILIGQVSEDMRRGGRAAEIVVDHVQRVGYAESTAQDAFGGLSRGLKRAFTQIAQGDGLPEERRQDLAATLTALQRLVEGN